MNRRERVRGIQAHERPSNSGLSLDCVGFAFPLAFVAFCFSFLVTFSFAFLTVMFGLPPCLYPCRPCLCGPSRPLVATMLAKGFGRLGKLWQNYHGGLQIGGLG